MWIYLLHLPLTLAVGPLISSMTFKAPILLCLFVSVIMIEISLLISLAYERVVRWIIKKRNVDGTGKPHMSPK